MKTYFTYLIILAVSLASCNSAKWASANYEDDLYFSRNDKPYTVSDEYLPVNTQKDLKKEDRKDFNQKGSEYSRSNPNYSLEQVTADLADVQTSYADLLKNDSISDVDTMLYYNDETGYWVNGFEGSPMDLDYATRLIRFHGPFVGIPYWSPLYSDILFFNSWDWNVYVDNNYAYVFPTYSNPAYWNSGFYLGFGYGWGNPWYNPWYSPYYPPYYGYYPPYYGYPPYCGPGYGYPGYPYHPGLDPIYSDNYYYGPRRTTSSTAKTAPDRNYRETGPRTMIKSNQGGLSTTRTTVTRTADNNMQIQKGTTTYNRLARANQPQEPDGDKKSVTTKRTVNKPGTSNVRTTRRSYSSYSPSRSTKRPTFNRSTYTRSSSASTKSRSTVSTKARSNSSYSSAPRRTSSKSYSTSSKARSVKTSRPTYKTGSSKSSTYSPSRYSGTSKSRSSYSSSPSRSSSGSGSFSSGSSVRSSRSSGSSGSSRSSGGSRGRR